MTRAKAYAKINLALVVGPTRADGTHEVVTVLQRIDLHDGLELASAPTLVVEGFDGDTLVRGALEALAAATGAEPEWRARIEKRIPVAAGLGGGSSDAAAALVLANARLENPLPVEELHRIAAGLGSDVPFFLRSGAQLATGSGTELVALDLPTSYTVLLVLPYGHAKESTAAVYRAFDARRGAAGFGERGAALREALARIHEPADLDRLPLNDLATSPLAVRLRELGAFRADVSGAGPAVYGLFDTLAEAERAARGLHDAGRTWVAHPVDRP